MSIDKTFLHDRRVGKLDYVIDWGPWLEAESDTISSVAWDLDTGLTEVTRSNTTTTATIWVTIDSSVPKNRLLEIRCTITTAGGRIERRSIRLKASEL